MARSQIDAKEPAGTRTAQERQFDDLVATQRDPAVRLAWRLLGGDGSAAEDVVQEAFVRAHRGLRRFRGEAKLSTWFHRILLREVARHRRWQAIRLRVAGAMPDESADPNPAAPSDHGLQRRIAAALEKLPRGQREAFVLIHIEGFTVSETAEIAGRAPGTIKSHLHRALRALRKELADLQPTSGENLE
ncbi:MAG: RNA polymerase sigma factor [bacterium]|nr:RNA polymerase sigma factor [bacterium]